MGGREAYCGGLKPHYSLNQGLAGSNPVPSFTKKTRYIKLTHYQRRLTALPLRLSASILSTQFL